MKLKPSLLSSIAIDIALGAIISARKTDANPGSAKQEKEKNQKRHADSDSDRECPACGLG
jgi:hypothetical protein